jgi:hypothetical protein
MRALLISFTTAASIIAASLYGCDRLENPQREYAAVTDEVFLGGWVPSLLPPTATEIQTQHNIDTNEVWVRFKLGTPDFDPAELGFRKAEPGSWTVQVRQPRHASWWFNSLSQFSPNNATLYLGACQDTRTGVRARSGHMLVVADEVYLWCSSASAA